MFKITDCIGNTPLIELDKSITQCNASIMVKLEIGRASCRERV